MSGTGYYDDADLARELTALGEHLRTPTTGAAVARIRAAATGNAPSNDRRTPRLVAAAVAIVTLAAVSMPPVRSAVADWLGIDGIRIRELPVPPPPPAAGAGLDLGQRVDLAEARRRADFELLLPRVESSAAGPEIYVRDVGGGIVSFVYGGVDGQREPVIVTEFEADPVDAFEKIIMSGTAVERLTIHGDDALWIDGAEHLLFFVDPTDGFIEVPGQLAGNTLLWTRGDVTLRLEGDLTREQAITIAEATNP